MSYIVRQAKGEDAESFIILMKELSVFGYNNALKMSASKDEAIINLADDKSFKIKNFAVWLSNLNKEKKQMVFLAVDNSTNEAVGFISADINENKHSMVKKDGYIADVYIREAHRKKGLADLLLKSILTWFKKMNVKHITLNVDVNNDNAIKLYSKMGFRKIMYKMSLYQG